MTTRMRRALRGASWTILAMAITLMATACGGTSSSENPTPSPSASPTPSKAPLITSADACSLVTAADASTAVGSTLANPSGSGGAQIPGACVYTSADGRVSVFVYSQLFSDTTTAQAASPERLAASLGSAYGVSNAKAVSGIGDRAVEYSATGAGGNGTVIFVFKSNAVVMVLITPSPESPAAVEQLAKTAVDRLK